jgi:hypothetical protein
MAYSSAAFHWFAMRARQLDSIPTRSEFEGIMRRAYLVIGWGIVLLGALHMFAATRLFAGVTPRAVWFFSGGMAMALMGALNLLNHSYGSVAPGLRKVCIGANIAMTAFGAVAGTVTNASPAEFFLVIGLTGGAAALSALKGSSLPPGSRRDLDTTA